MNSRLPVMTLLPVFVLSSFLGACGSGTPLTRAQLLDPQACATCHPDHVQQWSGSMHAYAADDPVFRAMNARGQRETGGKLGDFCVKCHAPMAVSEGATRNGLNLDQVPTQLKGVTCYFCHSVAAVMDDHNNALKLATDGVLRAGISNPVSSAAHPAAYSALLDRLQNTSASMCGGCHDVVNPNGVKIERTYEEWIGSVYNSPKETQLLTCGKCHMTGTSGLAAQAPGVLLRTVHDHSFPAVDTALTDFPHKDLQRAGINMELSSAITTNKFCVMPSAGDTTVLVQLDNVAVGHAWPSGANQDRRAWVELVAYEKGAMIYQTGQVADGQSPDPATDPHLWLLRDVLHDAKGNETHSFWDAAIYDATNLPPSVTNDPTSAAFFHAKARTFTLTGLHPDRVTVRVRLRAVGSEVLADLVKSGDLDASIAAKLPTLDLPSTQLEWNLASGYGCYPPAQ